MAKEQGVITVMWGYYMSGMGWWMVISFIFWLALLGIAIWLFARWAGRATLSNTRSASPTSSATEILRQRFARGEIDSDTFERMRRQLEASAIEPRTPASMS